MGRARALLTYSATRLGLAPLMLWLIASLVFLLLRLAPGDPVDAVLGSRAPAAAKAAMRARLGLDQSLLQQYLDYLNGLLHGDLGQALINQEPVSTIIGARSMFPSATPVTRFVAPGPSVPRHTPALPVRRP